MVPAPEPLDDEVSQLRRCQHGEPAALAELRSRYQQVVWNILRARGASPTEAEDLLADIWADCVPGPGERPSLLEKFSGKCSLQGWLATVATNRWVDFKRKHSRRAELNGGPEDAMEKALEQTAMSPAPLNEPILVALLRDSLKAAFAACPADAMVCLRLVFLHGVSQRDLMRMLGWSESKVSRFLTRAMAQIEELTLAELKKRDPWLELTWQDFVNVCETHQVGFL